MKLVNIDFEFNTPSEKYLNLVCCSLQLIEDGCHKDIERFWLFNGEEHTKGVLCDHLINLNELGYIFLSYGVGAEARSFISLGLDPMDFKWIDLYAEWRMARYNNNNFEYGRYLYKIKSDSGHLVKCEIRESVAPSFDARMNKGKDNTPTGVGYGDVVANVGTAQFIFEGVFDPVTCQQDIVHAQENLMRELAKVEKVIQRRLPGAPHEVLLVLDAITGQNAIAQAKTFTETIDVTGIFLAKIDGTARGGIVIAIKDQLDIPVKFVGLGEKPEDIAEFDPETFVDALFT